MSSYRTILGIQPHPDDLDLALGGFIRQTTQAGAHVTYLTVTDGSRGTKDPALAGPSLKAIRQAEEEKAARLLGVQTLVWLGYPDGGPIDPFTLQEDLTAAIRAVRPELVLMPDAWLPYEAHPDHRTVGEAAAAACLLSHLPAFATGRGTPFEVEATGFYFTRHPNQLIPISKEFSLKLEACACHESQFTREEVSALLHRRDQTEGGLVERIKILSKDRLHIDEEAVEA